MRYSLDKVIEIVKKKKKATQQKLILMGFEREKR